MALNAYLASTRQLLQNPPAPTTLYSDTNLTSWINEGRGQLAGQAKCIQFEATLALVANQQVYNFSSISLAGSVGIQGILYVRTIWSKVGNGRVWMRPRGFKWFSLYELNAINPPTGLPYVWSQYGQGVNGTVYLSAIPDQAYTLICDCTCYPIPLVDDTTAEAIPYQWTDAVQYYAAYKALLSAQSQARRADAMAMFNIFEEFVNRARAASTPEVLPSQYMQQPNPVRANQLGLQKKSGLGGLV